MLNIVVKIQDVDRVVVSQCIIIIIMPHRELLIVLLGPILAGMSAETRCFSIPPICTTISRHIQFIGPQCPYNRISSARYSMNFWILPID